MRATHFHNQIPRGSNKRTQPVVPGAQAKSPRRWYSTSETRDDTSKLNPSRKRYTTKSPKSVSKKYLIPLLMITNNDRRSEPISNVKIPFCLCTTANKSITSLSSSIRHSDARTLKISTVESPSTH